ncbi:DNA mismatch repair protein MSH3 isoform 1 [Hibiscus syriacus]|uniref:DNA mismatch repair protein MSH3 isoform 1 n=1 Tax=Hibiscus syriacus TaxID=106335 RepID=A0A6A3AR38_HIBSY|nr:DNA mismatch repair protein MSH3 isoform 1 [Hibiscus syriacus]
MLNRSDFRRVDNPAHEYVYDISGAFSQAFNFESRGENGGKEFVGCFGIMQENVASSPSPEQKDMHRSVLALIALNCSLIFVTGEFPLHFTHGSIPAIKLATYRRRLNSGNEVENQATQDGANSQKLSSLRRNMGSEFSCMIKEAKYLGSALGIPCLDGIEEAEAQCALLNLESLCDGCFSSDSDIFLFGARTVYRDICLGEGGHVVCYEMDDIEQKIGFGRNSLISLALLLGSDYSQGVHGLGLEAACQIVKSIGDNHILQKIVSEGLSFTRKKKNPKRQGQVECNNMTTTFSSKVNMNGEIQIPQKDNNYLQVVEAYMNPKCHSADSDVVHSMQHLLYVHQYDHAISMHFEHMNSYCINGSDEYLLPKIAERDLRRFAHLRSTSSRFDVNIPLKEVPVKCPVSAIIKRRKVNGKECFEVMWEESYGVKSSVVSADLVESACPEEVKEFDERRALGKKNQRKSRPKKSGKECSVAEIDLKLQDLLLDIELGSKSSPMASREIISDKMTTATEINFINRDPPVISDSKGNSDSRAAILCWETGATVPKHEVIDLLSPGKLQDLLLDIELGNKSSPMASREIISDKVTKGSDINFINRDLPVILDSEGNADSIAAILCRETGSIVSKHEVIDILSPSPLIHSRNVSRCAQMNDQHISIIDLSDSETEKSPEHARKAREFRVFLASIRDDFSLNKP